MLGDDHQTGVTDNAKRQKTDETPSTGDNEESSSNRNNVDPQAASSSSSSTNCKFNSIWKKKSLRNRNYRKSGEDESSGVERYVRLCIHVEELFFAL